MASNGASVGGEFDVSNGTYKAANKGYPVVLGFKDGTYGVFWVKSGVNTLGAGAWFMLVSGANRYLILLSD